MQATDLFMGLLGSKRAGTPDQLPRKADVAAVDKTVFSSELSKAMDRTTQPKSHATVKAAAKSERPEAAVEVKAPEQKSESSNVQDTKADNAVSDKTTGNGSQAKAGADKADRAEKPTENSRKEASDDSAKVTAQNPNQDAEKAEQTDEQSELDAKLAALTERLEKDIAGDEIAEDDKELAELIVELLAFFLSQAKQDGEVQADGDSQITLTLNVDPESKLGKLLTMLMDDENAATDEILANVNALIKLTDDKGLLIPVTELLQAQAGADSDNAEGITLNLAGDAEEALKISLTFDAESLNSAKLVDLSENGLQEQSDMVVEIPLDTIVQASGQSSIDALVEKLQQGQEDLQLDKLLDALGMTKKELAQALSKETAPETRISVSISASDGNDKSELAPVVKTTETNFINSDEYLKSLELQTLMKEATDAKSDRKEIMARIERLTGGQEGKNDGLLKLLVAKVGGILDSSSFMDMAGGQSDKSFEQWTSGIAKQVETAATQNSNAPAEVVSDRIPFLGRPARDISDFGMILQKNSAPVPTRSGQEVAENVMRQLIQRVAYNFGNGNEGEVRVLLRPASLGTIDLKVKIDQDVVVARITAESHAVKAIIESNLGQLKNSLQEQGVQVGKFEVNVDSGSQQNAQNGSQDRTGDAYSTGYSTREDSGEQPLVDIPDMMDGEYAYARPGESTAASSRMSYLA